MSRYKNTKLYKLFQKIVKRRPCTIINGPDELIEHVSIYTEQPVSLVKEIIEEYHIALFETIFGMENVIYIPKFGFFYMEKDDNVWNLKFQEDYISYVEGASKEVTKMAKEHNEMVFSKLHEHPVDYSFFKTDGIYVIQRQDRIDARERRRERRNAKNN